jgi:HNH endonuclease
MPKDTPSPEHERRLLRHLRPADDGCIEFTGKRQQDGYGQITVNGRSIVAHRVAYEFYVGPIPDGLVLDHLCRNPGCVNPAHLEPVTQRVNLLRGIGVNAINAAKTHCIHGHEFTPENTYAAPSRPQRRDCRVCRARRRAAWLTRR